MKQLKNLIYVILFCILISPSANGDIEEQALLFVEVLNEYRVQNNRHPVTLCIKLSHNSRRWSETMRARGTIWHDKRRGDGSSEICLMGAKDATHALRMWQRSTGHNAILLSHNIDTIGVGISGTFWTMRGLKRERAVRTKTVVTIRKWQCEICELSHVLILEDETTI